MSERSAVQDPMLKYAQEIGWLYLSPDQALDLRGSIEGQVLVATLTAQLRALNPFLTPDLLAEVLRRLRILPATIEGNRDALRWLRGEMTVFVPAENRELNVSLIDFDSPDQNTFNVTEEWRHKSAVFTNRADVVFLVNGIPVVIAELKAAEKANGAEEGIEQVRRYHRETPEMLALPQVFEVSQMLALYYGPTWAASRKNLLNWKDDAPDDKAFEAKVKGFFNRPRLMRVLKEYVIFLFKDDILSKVILRQHQTRAVDKVADRVSDPTRSRALIWHTQGSGKTLTMITIASNLLRSTVAEEKPTVVMLVDRNELETQLFQNISAYGITSARVAKNKRDLQDILRSDFRGLVVSMIHKFDDVPANLNNRHGIVILVDEAHRTTGGDLGNYLMAALPNATYIGFTGTPIDGTAKGKGTFKTFGIDDERGYLDKYSIAESIEDGTTVRLHYALAPSDLRLNRETLERQFLSLTQAEGVADVEELNAILDRAILLKEVMKAHTRVENIAAFVAKHFRESVEPMGFKAFLVAVDREACAMYKEELDKRLSPEVSRVVISPAQNDSELLKRQYLDPLHEKEVRKNFISRDKLPQILIVTEKLLTGFDAPILYTLYLDKPMRDHVLLQNLDVLKNLFVTMLKEEGQQYLVYARGWTDKEKERAIEAFEDKGKREKYYKWYRQVSTFYDILSPDAFLRPHIQNYQALSMLYALLRNAYAAQMYVDSELTVKTRSLLRENTTSYSVELPDKMHSLGPTELAALKQSGDSDVVKILNLRKTLAARVAADAAGKPFLVAIGECADALVEAYEDRQLTTQQVLEAFEELADETVQAEAERAQLGLDENAFAVYSVLRPLVVGVTSTVAQSINSLFVAHPDYAWDAGQGRRLRIALYKVLRPLVGGQMTDVASTLIRLRRV